MVLNHEGVRRVVWEKYVQSSQTKLTYHRILANYFQLQKTSHRKMEELPWHLEKLENWFKLKEILVDVEMFKLWWTDTHRSTFIRIWSVLCRPPARFDLVAEYNKSVERHVSRYDQLSAESS
jgi:hypothetical protein